MTDLPTGYRIETDVSCPTNRGRRTRRPVARGVLITPSNEVLMYCHAELADEWDRESAVTIPDATYAKVAEVARNHASARAEAAEDPATEQQVSTIMRLAAPYRASDEPLAIEPPRTLQGARELSRTEAAELIAYLHDGA